MQEFPFYQYRVFNIFQKVFPEVRQKIIRMWENAKIAPQDMNFEERSKQVVLATVNCHEQVVGVTTVYPGFLNKDQDNESCYFYRMFIRREDRRPQLMRYMLNKTYEVLHEAEVLEKPKSLAMILENPKLSRPGSRRTIEKCGYAFAGYDINGNIIYQKYFSKD